MRMMRYKPSKPAAVLGIVMGIGMLFFGIYAFRDAEGFPRAFLVFWCVMVVGITALNTWAAFAKKGSVATIAPFGMEVEDDEDARRTDRR